MDASKLDTAWVLGGVLVPFLGLIWSELRSVRSLLTGALAAQAGQAADIKNMQEDLRTLPCRNGGRCG
jgi:hypothetical protein